jgi:hypothetical protein
MSSSVKIPFTASPLDRRDPSSGCADAQAPSLKDFSSSLGAFPPSLPPSPPASDGGDKEAGFDVFDSFLADTVPRPELPPAFSGPFEPLPYPAPDDSVLSPDEDEV